MNDRDLDGLPCGTGRHAPLPKAPVRPPPPAQAGVAFTGIFG